ncbi:MAG TPA: TolC family protein [Chitinophagaceae bacterium]|nr:TolC family protein [Chitinophagaceae bacterium]
MMRKLILTAISFQLLITSASAQQKWNLRSAVDYALANNISVKQQDVQARITELTLKQSKLSQYPSLSLNGNVGYSSGRNQDPTTFGLTTIGYVFNQFSLQSNADVFNFFSKKNTIAGNDLETKAAFAAVDKLKNDIALNVAGYYLQILLNNEAVKLNEGKIELTKAQLINTRKLVEAGSQPELNAAQLEAQLATDSSNLITAQGVVIQSTLALKALMNVDAALSFEIETPPIESIPLESLAELAPDLVYALALANLPQNRVNDFRVKAAQKFVQAAKGAMYPTFSAFGSLGSTYNNRAQEIIGVTTFTAPIGKVSVSGTEYSVFPLQPFSDPTFAKSSYFRQFDQNFRQSIGLSVNVPILNGGSLRTQYDRSKLNLQSAQLQQSLDQQTLKQDIYRAYADALTAMQKFTAASKSVQTNQIAYDYAAKRYEVGLLNPIDLIIAQNNLFTAQINRISAQFEYVFKMKVLEFYKGQGIKL